HDIGRSYALRAAPPLLVALSPGYQSDRKSHEEDVREKLIDEIDSPEGAGGCRRKLHDDIMHEREERYSEDGAAQKRALQKERNPSAQVVVGRSGRGCYEEVQQHTERATAPSFLERS